MLFLVLRSFFFCMGRKKKGWRIFNSIFIHNFLTDSLFEMKITNGQGKTEEGEEEKEEERNRWNKKEKRSENNNNIKITTYKLVYYLVKWRNKNYWKSFCSLFLFFFSIFFSILCNFSSSLAVFFFHCQLINSSNFLCKTFKRVCETVTTVPNNCQNSEARRVCNHCTTQ